MTKKLAFILLDDSSAEAPVDKRYWFLWNKHLASPNMLGGHVEDGETFQQAAVRELHEELGASELNKDYGLAPALADSVEYAAQLDDLANTLTEVGPPSQIAMFSLRADLDPTQALGKADTVREVQFLSASLHSKRHRLVMERLERLSEITVRLPQLARHSDTDQARPGITVSLTAEELAVVSRFWAHNPFIDYAFAIGTLTRPEQNRQFRPWGADSLELSVQLQRALRRITVGKGLPGDVGNQPYREVAVRVIESDTDPEGVSGRIATIELRQPQWPEDPIKIQVPWPEHGAFREVGDEPGESKFLRWVNVLHPIPVSMRVPEDGEGASGKSRTAENGQATGANRLPRELGKLAAQFRLTPLRELRSKHQQSGDGEPLQLKTSKATHSRSIEPSMGAVIQEMLCQALEIVDPVGETKPLDKDDLRRFYVQTTMAYWLRRILLRCVVAAACQKPNWAWTQLKKLLVGADYGLSGLRRRGLVTGLSAINGVDLAAQLNEVKRRDVSATRSASISPKDRQLHASHKGLICVFETPESSQIGLTMHFTPYAYVKGDGRLVFPCAAQLPMNMMGLSAQFIPFSAHNDAARNTIGAKNLRQAVQVVGSEAPYLGTQPDPSSIAEISPLGQALGLLGPGERFSKKNMLPGANLLVAYMPWNGFNTDDAIVISASGAKKLARTELTRYFHRLKPGVSVDVVVSVNSDILRGGILAKFTGSDGAYLRPLRAQQQGTIESLNWEQPPSAALGGTLDITIRETRMLMPGDKLMGRYGNKGVVAIVMDDAQMPRLPADRGLPNKLAGRAVEVVLNPLGVISRMNLGQLMETQLTWAVACQGDGAVPDLVAEPLANETQRKTLRLQAGVVLDLSADAKTERPVTVGYQFFLRLKHSPADKGVYRDHPDDPSAYDPLTGQPVRGRVRVGGQRFGEMEMWVLAAQQANPLMQAMLGSRSCKPHAANDDKGVRVWASIQQHFFAAGCDMVVAPDGQKMRLERTSVDVPGKYPDYEPEQTETQIKTERYATRWQCKVCSAQKLITLNGKDQAVRVFVTQRKKDVGTLDGVLASLGFNPELRSSLGTQLGSVQPVAANETGYSSSLALDDQHVDVNYRRTEKSHKLTLTLPDQTKLHFFESGNTKNLLGMRWFCDTHASGNGWLIPQPPFESREEGDDPVDTAQRVIRFDDVTSCPVLPVTFRASEPDSTGRMHRTPLEEAYRRMHRAACNAVEPEKKSTPEVRNEQDRRRRFLFWREAAAQIAWHTLTGTFAHPGWIGSKLDPYVTQAVTRALRRAPFNLRATDAKHALLRSAGLGRRVNDSGRFVITPNPEIKISQVGIPMAAAAVMWHQEIAAWLLRQGEAASGDSQDTTESDAANVWLMDWDFQSFPPIPDVSVKDCAKWDSMYATLRDFLDAHPSKRVMLNRQPTLHRSSMLAFEPVVLDWKIGWVLQIHPLVCKGFNADFDGDEMVIHSLPDELAPSVQTMGPLHLTQRISMANGKSVMVNDQDAKLGEYVRERAADNTFSEMLEGSDDEQTLEPKLTAWYRRQVERATNIGYSLTMRDLIGAADAVIEPDRHEVGLQATSAATAKQYALLHKTLNTIAATALAKADTASLADLIESNARAKKDTHPRQLWVSRGFLSPGELNGDPLRELDQSDSQSLEEGDRCDPRFWCKSNLVNGLNAEDFFNAAYNGRSTLADKKLLPSVAGTITRQLVFHAWGWQVHGDRCNSSTADPLHCQQSTTHPRSICRACLGNSLVKQYPNGGPTDGFPIGLIAAQTFGERGTQLSMQSYKGGGRLANPESIKRRIAKFSKAAQALQMAGESEKSTELVQLMKSFVDDLVGVSAYQGIDPFWIMLLGRILAQPEGAHGLDELVGSFSRPRIALEVPGIYEVTPSTALLLGAWPSDIST